MKLFNRSKFISSYSMDNYIVQIQASLVDTIHEMDLKITVDLKQMQIVEASSSMLRVPYNYYGAS